MVKKIFQIILLVFLSNLLHAHDSINTDEMFKMSIKELMNIKISAASRKLEHANDAPGTVYVISKDDILIRGYVTLKDVLRDLPGMETIENYFSESGTLVPVRGIIDNNKIVVLVNGMRINPPGGESLMLRSDISVKMAEQIEIVYGPGSTLYGRDAISAIINIVTKQPDAKGFIESSIAGGSENHKEGYLGIAKKINNNDFSGLVQYYDANFIDLSSAYPQYWDKNYRPFLTSNNMEISPKRWDKGFNTFLRIANDKNSIQLWHRDSSRNSAEGSYVKILYFTDEAVWHDNSTAIEAKNIFPLSSIFTLESSLSFNQYEIAPESRYIWPLNSTSLFYNDYKYGIGKGMSLDEKAMMSYDKLSIIAGFTVSYFDILPKSTIPGGADKNKDITSQGGTFTYYTELGNPNSKVETAKANNILYTSIGYYAELNYQVNEALSAVAGARYDVNSRYSSIPFSPRIAAVYKYSETTTFKYIFTKAFVSPPPYYIYNVFDNGTAINTYNTDLAPEEAQSNEININYIIENFALNFSAYAADQNNLLIFGDRALPVNTIQEVVYTDLAGTGTRKLTHSVNGGKSQSRGIDISGRYAFGGVSLWGSYSIVDFETEIDGQKSGLDEISKNNIRLGVDCGSCKKILFSTSLIFRSTPYNLEDKAKISGLEDEIINPLVINAHIQYKLNNNISVFTRIDNALNNKYALKGLLAPTPQETLKISIGLNMYLRS